MLSLSLSLSVPHPPPLPSFAGRGACVCESNTCEYDRAPLSGFTYFGQGTTSSDGINGGCECNPDHCYNTNFPMVSEYVLSIFTILFTNYQASSQSHT